VLYLYVHVLSAEFEPGYGILNVFSRYCIKNCHKHMTW